jgi:hypothetical protein
MEELAAMRDPAVVWFPYGFSRSPAEPVVDTTQGRFGPFAGQMLVADAAAPRILRVMLEKVDGVWQGACADFYSGNGLRNGSNRMVFSPDGKALYVGQTMREWSGAMEGLQRIIFEGGKVFEVRAMRLKKDGFELEFTEPVDAGSAEKAEDFPTEIYRYGYESKYGGEELDLRKVVPTSVKWGSDRRTVRLGYSELAAGWVYRVTVNGARSGEPLGHPMVAYTVNRLLK